MKKGWAINIWKNGDYFDVWHVNHFLAGPVCAGLATYLFIPFWPAFIATAFLMFSWEIYEIIIGIKETRFNRVMDVLLGVVGFFLWYILKENICLTSQAITYILILFVWLTLELWGYIAYKKLKTKNK